MCIRDSLFERAGTAVLDAEAELQDLFLARRKGGEHVDELLLQERERRGLARLCLLYTSHALEGVSVKDKILVFPGGKGSSVVQMDGLYKLELNGAAPLGFIVREPDTVLVSTAIIMEIPMVDHVEDEFYNAVKTGDQIEINASEELAAVTMLKHND